MSTRSYKTNDENAAPHYVSKQHTAAVAKDGATKKIGRNALGDISNTQKQIGSNDRLTKKTRTVTDGLKKQNSLKSPSGDVKMKENDTASLANHVADLRLDVDFQDQHNPLACTEYIGSIMEHMRMTEHARVASPNYMSNKQNDINSKMREILIDWLVEVHLKFKLKPETLFLTVNLIDRFLEIKTVKRQKLQLVGCTAMLIASKYEEIYAPEVRDFVYISDRAYTRDEILSMESIMLNALGFHCTAPSALRFSERLIKVNRCDRVQEFLVKYLVELQLQDYKFLKFLPSTIAASAMYVSNDILNKPKWSTLLEAHSKKSEADLSECTEQLKALAGHTPPKYKAVRKKYANKKYHAVSTLPVDGAVPYKR